jgi:hypothetical protein
MAVILRLGFARDTSTITPGLYFVGKPDASSPVIVTANYRLTFDALRKELAGLSLWIAVVDTRGINVWCAAGKGTLNAELVARSVGEFGVKRHAPRATIVLPQLSASGVNARALSESIGMPVRFGPVRAKDIPAFLANAMEATDEMRLVRFGPVDRIVLAPVEAIHSLWLAAAFLAVAGFLAAPIDGGFASRYLLRSAYLVGSLFVAIVAFPLALPFLPGKYFSVKGAVLHLAWTTLFRLGSLEWVDSCDAGAISAFLLSLAACSYIAMNFTGSTTFTSQRGVEREVNASVIPIIASAAFGILLCIYHFAIALIG